MERSKLVKWLFLGLAVFLFIQFGKPLLFGNGPAPQQPLADLPAQTFPTDRATEQTCTIDGARFTAELSSRGGSLRHLWMTEPKYTHGPEDGEKLGKTGPIDLVTTTMESRMPLRTALRVPGDTAAQQVPYDDLDWKISAQDGKSCTFTYADEKTRVTKVVAANGEPYQMTLALTVENLASESLKHRLTVEQTAWRTAKETEGNLGRISEWLTESVAATTEKTERLHPDAFEPDDFKDEHFTAEKWRRTPGDARLAAVSSSYFSKLTMPVEGPTTPSAEALIEAPSPSWPGGFGDYWAQAIASGRPLKDDRNFGHIYRARLAYPEVELHPHATATYKLLSYHGPKERGLLAAVGDGAGDVIDLGWFSPIAKVLVSYVYILYGLIGSWGWAICLLTITVRILLFPLSIQQIKSTAAMRKLKPEMDEINAKFKDDATQRGLAMQELWRKNKVANPVVGCFPLLLQMPVWFALYSALQTAVELYHTPFGPVIPDLSSPGKYFIIPVVLGASSFFQQRIMPPQGDPAQQKMMLYLMPGVFTVMMLFLPAGLGVYMLTNTWLGIAQQVLVERYLKNRDLRAARIEVRQKTSG